MQITKLPAIFQPARPVLQRIEQAGYEAYFVGGCVRDTILGDHIHDIDIATSAYPSEIKQIFSHTVDTGIQHGTVMILDHGVGYETTTFRTESGYQDFRRPDHVTFVRSLKDDLKRRDFTINALAMKEDGNVIDLFDGLGDLKRHLIRAVGNPEQRFHEDALRMMRAVRFASKLDFSIDPDTFQAIKDHNFLIAKIAIERVESEFTKLLLGQNPVTGLKYLIDSDLYKYCPGLSNAASALDKLCSYSSWQKITTNNDVWLAICFSMGFQDRKAVRSFLKKWRLSNELISSTQSGIVLMQAVQRGTVSNTDLFNAGLSVIKSVIAVADLFSVPHEDLIERFSRLQIQDSHQLNLDGKDLIQELRLQPGPLLGKVIHQIQTQVINNELKNDHQTLIKAAQTLIEKG